MAVGTPGDPVWHRRTDHTGRTPAMPSHGLADVGGVGSFPDCRSMMTMMGLRRTRWGVPSLCCRAHSASALLQGTQLLARSMSTQRELILERRF